MSSSVDFERISRQMSQISDNIALLRTELSKLGQIEAAKASAFLLAAESSLQGFHRSVETLRPAAPVRGRAPAPIGGDGAPRGRSQSAPRGRSQSARRPTEDIWKSHLQNLLKQAGQVLSSARFEELKSFTNAAAKKHGFEKAHNMTKEEYRRLKQETEQSKPEITAPAPIGGDGAPRRFTREAQQPARSPRMTLANTREVDD
jgi:hypothetical protein